MIGDVTVNDIQVLEEGGEPAPVPEPKEKRFPVMEIFGPTIQGEGVVIGTRTLFVRFGLCDYKCTMCDSMHAVDPISVKNNARRMTAVEIADELIRTLQRTNCSWVTLSGGNPAIHDLSTLTCILREFGVPVSIETQGTFAPDWIYDCSYITVSPKGPGMGEKFEPQKYKAFYDKFHEHSGFSVKVVVFDVRDLEFASMIAQMSPHTISRDRFYLSHGNPYPPVLATGDAMPEALREDWLNESIRRYEMMVDELKDFPALRTARFLPQLHHWIWSNEKGR